MSITEEDRKRMGTVNPELAEAVKQRSGPVQDGDNSQRRQQRFEHLAKLRHLYPIPGPIPAQVIETNHSIQARDGYQIPIKIYKPVKPPQQASPVIVMFHEGGWRMGDLTDEDLNCRMFTRDLGAVCVNVDYRLAPENKFPSGVNDAYDAVKWCANTASPSSDILPGDPKTGFIVGGASAGGNFAAIVCQTARDEGLSPPLTGQYLCVPALLTETAVPEKWKSMYRSRAESVNDPIIKPDPGRSQNRLDVLGVKADDVRYSPALHPDLAGLPPAYFQLGGLDPLRDEALIYEEELRNNNTATRLDVYDGFGHMFWTNWPELQRSREFVNDTLAGVKWLLEQR